MDENVSLKCCAIISDDALSSQLETTDLRFDSQAKDFLQQGEVLMEESQGCLEISQFEEDFEENWHNDADWREENTDYTSSGEKIVNNNEYQSKDSATRVVYDENGVRIDEWLVHDI